jgi:hypothetical protein
MKMGSTHGPWAVDCSAGGGGVRVDLAKNQTVATAAGDLHLIPYGAWLSRLRLGRLTWLGCWPRVAEEGEGRLVAP